MKLPEADITDEELAEIETGRVVLAAGGPTVRRLVAALRASREEVERLRADNEHLHQMVGLAADALQIGP